MRKIINLFKTVFIHPFYIAWAVVIGFMFFLANLWLISYSYLSFVFFSGFFTTFSKLGVLFNVPNLVSMKFTATSLIISVLISIFLGINMSALLYYFKKQVMIKRTVGSSLFGAMVGSLGIGCASCGSVVISSVFGIGASSAFIGILPLSGHEFGIIGIIILSYSIYMIAKKIDQNFACKINSKNIL